jgi:hypothetical protein
MAKNSPEGNRRRTAAYRDRSTRREIGDGVRRDDGTLLTKAVISEDGRECTRCHVFKPWSEFCKNRQSKSGHRPECRPCHTDDTIRHRSDRRAVDPDAWDSRRSDISMKHRHGISPAEYNGMLEAQGGGCAICGSPDARTKRKGHRPLVVDHDHKTGAVRGLLCDPCNNGLGRFDDDIERLKKAAHYLEVQPSEL